MIVYRIFFSIVLSTLLIGVSQAQAPAASPAAPTARPTTSAPAVRPAPGRPAVAPVQKVNYRFKDLNKEESPEVFRMKTQAPAVISQGKFKDDQEKKDFESYYKEYVFGRWINDGPPVRYVLDAWPDRLRKRAVGTRNPADKKKLLKEADSWDYPGFHEDFRADLNRSRGEGEPQNLAQKIAYDFACDMIANTNPRCNRALKYNCVLLLGDLYARKSSAGQDKPIAYAAAFDYIIQLISDPKTPRYLQLGALNGLNSFLSNTNLSDEQKKRAYAILLTILKTKVNVEAFASSKEDPTGAGAVWARELAIACLKSMSGYIPREGEVSTFYPSDELPKELGRIIVDKKAPTTTRIAALESLGSINFAKAKITSSRGYLMAAAMLVVDSIQEELNRKSDPLIWGNENDLQSRIGGNIPGQETTEPRDDYKDAAFLRQRAIPVLYAARTALAGVNQSKGLGGLSGLGSEEDKKKAVEMTRELRTAVNDLSKENPKGEQNVDDQGNPITSLQKVAGNLETIRSIFSRFATPE